MAGRSVANGAAKHEPPSTRSVVADEALCSQVAGCMGIPEDAARKAFLGEPVEETLSMARWAMGKALEDEDFDAKSVLLAWAQKRGRGAWSTRKRKTPRKRKEPSSRELAVEIARYWTENPDELVKALDRTRTGLANGNGR